MEKQVFIFNAKLGVVEKDAESFICEPFFSAALRHGDLLVKEEDFIILNEVAVSRGYPPGKKEELVSWLADRIREFKKEETITEESVRAACQIIEHILAVR
jgi:hypothetical protein